ncbi:hypothetical protein [Tunicatimonas pelagia]|uniref:hypothetical protein n=1 Tax=Tunicatimonas pelagia TaxID=931531 RepID=UPI0026661382|nr:hypothetical protein [Tunicatimonas pelagia]WKN43983.1 hypothetical protein P0M28_03225 [Tunicatimonas pelagia]
MILIDTNALTLLIVGLIDSNQIEKHRRTSIYTEKDFHKLLSIIQDFSNLLILPNIWTEVDNLLNNFLTGNLKWPYIQVLRESIPKTSERYLRSELGANSNYFISIGLTDSLIIELREEYDLLITADSKLSDLAKAHGITVYDLKEERNEDFR